MAVAIDRHQRSAETIHVNVANVASALPVMVRARVTEAPAPLEAIVTRTLFEATNKMAGLRAALESICLWQHWDSGTFWSLSRSGAMTQTATWTTGQSCRQSVLAAQRSIPAWVDATPICIGDLSADAASPETPLGTGILVPVRDGNDLIGVLDFPLEKPLLDAETSLALQGVARVIQQFCAHMLLIDVLRESEQRMAATIGLAAIGIGNVDEAGRFVYVNPQLCKMLGYTAEELTGMHVKEISHPEDISITDGMREKLRHGVIESFKMEKRYLHKDGSTVWVALTIAAKREMVGRRVTDIAVIEDISARKKAEERVTYLATHDALTGLPNRAMFAELLSHHLESVRRHGRKLAVMFVDLDRFKIINDSLGHEAGDVLLRETAQRLRSCVRGSDVVARLGGDEFVILLPEVASQEDVTPIARAILSTVMAPMTILGQECRVTGSIGVCVHPGEGQDDQSIMKYADMAMYRAKEDGKNNCQYYSPDIQAQSTEQLKLEANLRHALEQGELSLHYQAKVHFQTGAITGVEALLRWQSPVLGAVSPARFIPIAEETGLIVPIGKWVLRTACAQNMAWQRRGLAPVRMCVNLSMRQLDDPHLVKEIETVLKETGMAADLLELEMTESMVMNNAERAVQILTAIKALGVRLAIDDFGTGYSSLAQLKRFPIDTLKVDRSFIREVSHDAEDRAITEAIIAMGKTLSLTIVAEGVESEEQQAFLREHACDEMQGYFFSVPLPAEDFAALLARHEPETAGDER